MKRLLVILAITLSTAAALAESLDRLPLSSLEQRLIEINARLTNLAYLTLGSGVGAIGYRSMPRSTAEHSEWVQINFESAYPLDEVVLVPAIQRDSRSNLQADAFPSNFRLVAGTDNDPEGLVVAQYNQSDNVLPRIAPLIIPCNGIIASWIRIEVLELPLRTFDARYAFQLSEVLAFSGDENVALHSSVTASSSHTTLGWSERFIVDGVLPYVMNAAAGEKSVAYLTPPNAELHPHFDIDLGHSYPINRIHLHAVDQSDTFPQAFAGDFGIPKHLRIEGANKPDFSDAHLLLNLYHKTIYDVGPIMMWKFQETTCRYIRLAVQEPFSSPFYGNIQPRTGFAEIEVFSKGRNVAFGKPVSTTIASVDPRRPLHLLTNGLNIYGNILPIRDWLNQLAERHELETRRPFVVAELNRRYARQKTKLTILSWLLAASAAGIAGTILIDRILRRLAIHKTRERIAADLHDELGANLHAIGLLGDLAQKAKDSPDKLARLLQRMRELTERTGTAARHCTDMLEAEDLHDNIVDDMGKTAARIIADLDYSTEFSGAEYLSRLKLRRRIDLFLFYKECLINIIRHSGATEVRISLTAEKSGIKLIINDNGHGLGGTIPKSLHRRARYLGALVKSEPSDNGGARISLSLKYNKIGVLL